MGESPSPSDSIKQHWYWPFDSARHGHLLHRSKGRTDIQEYELGRLAFDLTEQVGTAVTNWM